jgi:hypothetical protein
MPLALLQLLAVQVYCLRRYLCKARTGLYACIVSQADGMPPEFPASP